MRICFVCLGNICRSPTAEGVMAAVLADAGRSSGFELDSAGTSAYHVGERPDARSQAAAKRHGVALPGRARQLVRADFERFDLIVVMDRRNLRDARAIAGPTAGAPIALLRAFDPLADDVDVPDPYYGAGDGFERVFQICRAGCAGLLRAIDAGGLDEAVVWSTERAP
jgi:protein-tyrosine phosphatase